MNPSFDLETIVAKFETPEVTYLTANQNSWVVHVKRFYSNANFESLWEMRPSQRRSIYIGGREVLLPRLIENFGIDYKFSGRMFPGQQTSADLKSIIEKIEPLVLSQAGTTMLNNCLVNWYQDGEQYIGPHSDNEKELYTLSPVISLSLGATRKFRLTPKPSYKADASSVDINVSDGDLLIMGGATQFTHYHSVPKSKTCKERRISITMRCMRN